MERSDAADRLALVRARIAAAAAAVGRDPESVQLLAVSKFHPSASVTAMHAAGQRRAGPRNYQRFAATTGIRQ